MASLGDAFRDADELLTMVSAIPAGVIVLLMALNFGNPDFPALHYFELGMKLVVSAAIPSIGMIFFVGIGIYALQVVDNF